MQMKPFNRYRLFFAAGIALLASSFLTCVDSIDFKPKSDVISSLTVNGKLVYSNPSFVTVTAGRIIDYTPTPTEGLDLKDVLLYDEAGHEVSIPAVGIGKYALTIPQNFPGIQIERGKSYGIRLETKGGKQYESTLEPLLPVPEPISLTYESMIKHVIDPSGSEYDVPYLNFYLKTNILEPSSSRPSILHLAMEQTTEFQDTAHHTCYRTQPINDNNIRLINGYEFTTDQVEIFVYETPPHSGFSGDSYIHVIQESLPENAYSFYQSIQKVIARNGNMFEDPVGKVRSNISNVDDPEEDIFGFFYATEADTIRVFVDPMDLPPGITPYCIGSGQNGDSYIYYCQDCRIDPASTTVKPYYWHP